MGASDNRGFRREYILAEFLERAIKHTGEVKKWSIRSSTMTEDKFGIDIVLTNIESHHQEYIFQVKGMNHSKKNTINQIRILKDDLSFRLARVDEDTGLIQFNRYYEKEDGTYTAKQTKFPQKLKWIDDYMEFCKKQLVLQTPIKRK